MPGAAASRQIEERIAAALRERPEVLDAYLFGSVAAGRAQAHSDVDVAVYVEEERARDRGFGLQADLTAHLMSALRTNDVDLVVLNEASPLLYHRVLRDGHRILSRDLAATTTREGRALSRYCDYVPQIAKIEAARAVRAAAPVREE